MDSAPLSAVDTFTPAFERMKYLLFKPFRLGIWARFAIVGLFAGEMSSSGFNFNFPANWKTSSPAKTAGSFAGQSPFHWPSVPHLFAWIAFAAAIAMVLMLVFMYISSVLRFVLFDAVLTGNIRLRNSWRRWRQRGTAFFPWQIGFSLVTLCVYAVLIGIPIFAAWRAGIFRNPAQHIALLILGGLAVFFVAAVIVLLTLAVYVLAKDFVVPIMAFEGVGPIAAWRRLMLMMSTSKGSYAGYLGFKAVLAIAAGIAVGIVSVILLLIVLVPVVIVGVLLGIASIGGATGLSAAALTLLIVGGIVIGFFLLCVIALLQAPVVVFFQSYALTFFGSRYEPLRRLIYPQPPPPPSTDPLPEPAV